MKLSKIKNIHFIGIGGVGMVGIAEMLINQGYKVSGSDLVSNNNVKRLKSLGAHISIGHHAKNIKNCDVVVFSSAVGLNNSEMREARKQSKIIIPRAEMLSGLMTGYQSIAVAGSHGKTTTTSLISYIFTEAKLDPTYIIGGRILGKEEKSILGKSNFIIVEADESDGSFLHLNPEISVLTNIDNDHLDFYDNKPHKLEKTFFNFMEKLPFFGTAIICVDCKKSDRVFKKLSRPKISYGFSKHADFRIINQIQKPNYQQFEVYEKATKKTQKLRLRLPGKHNALNAVASLIVCKRAGIKISVIKKSFDEFGGVSRRIENKGDRTIGKAKITLIDDYGHHPTEINETVAAVRSSFKNRRITMIFQPHRFSRSVLLFEDFIKVLSKVDRLIVMDIYSANEENPNGISSYDFVSKLVSKGVETYHGKNLSSIKKILEEKLDSNDILLTQGAGNVSDISTSLSTMYDE